MYCHVMQMYTIVRIAFTFACTHVLDVRCKQCTCALRGAVRIHVYTHVHDYVLRVTSSSAN
jgi:hypothetical protein